MSKKPTYFELLKDPRWQRKRLEIMKEADFACVHCGEMEKPLNVHHGYYEKGKMPWEYPNNTLHCLCEDCHRIVSESALKLKQLIGTLSGDDVDRVYGYVLGLKSFEGPDHKIVLDGIEEIFGFTDARMFFDWEVVAEMLDKDHVLSENAIQKLRIHHGQATAKTPNQRTARDAMV